MNLPGATTVAEAEGLAISRAGAGGLPTGSAHFRATTDPLTTQESHPARVRPKNIPMQSQIPRASDLQPHTGAWTQARADSSHTELLQDDDHKRRACEDRQVFNQVGGWLGAWVGGRVSGWVGGRVHELVSQRT